MNQQNQIRPNQKDFSISWRTIFQNKWHEHKTAILLYTMLFGLFVCLVPKKSFEGDTNCWIWWSRFIFEHGLSNTYKFSTDYPPLYQYVLYGYSLLQSSIDDIPKNIYLLKAFTLIFDFVGVVFVYRILKEKVKDQQKVLLLSLFLLLNVAYLYNTFLWGQVDAIMAAFIFLGFYYAIKERVLVSFIFILFSLNMKLQAIIFLPFFFLILLPVVIRKFSGRNVFLWIIVPMTLQFLILLPFILAGDLGKMWQQVVITSMGRYPFISLNGYNIWYWFVDHSLNSIPDTRLFLGITYNKWGLLMFTIVYTIVLVPLMKNTFGQIFKGHKESMELEKLLLTAGLIPLVFFFFNTQMHERYCHASLIFIATYSFLSGNYFPYILFSLAYFLNLEDVARIFEWGNYNTFILSGKVIGLYFFISMITMLLRLYEMKIRKLSQ